MGGDAGTGLDAFVERLAQFDLVDGVVLVGTTGTDRFTAASDHDILIVHDQGLPPVHVGAAWIGGRFTDLLFATTLEVDELVAADAPVESTSWPGRIVKWVLTGTIVVDRSGRLGRLRDLARETSLVTRPGESDRHRTWFSINYDLAQNLRMWWTGDAAYRTAVEVRLLYATFNLLLGYFSLRGLDWEGEKAALHHLVVHDPEYLEALLACLRATTPTERFDRYYQLAERTLAPFGGTWTKTTIAFQFRAGTVATDALMAEARDVWGPLIDPATSPD